MSKLGTNQDLRDDERLFTVIIRKLTTTPDGVHKSRRIYMIKICKSLLPALPYFCPSSDDIFILAIIQAK